jgi:PIN domain nuclease of toxin-antitoxin system
MIAYLRDETGADIVQNLLVDDTELCMAHAINLCEVYYKLVRYTDKEEVRSAIQDLLEAKGLAVREDLDEAFWLDVGRHKAAMGSVPLADCFVVTLANRTEAEVVTADHPDFDPIEEEGICQVRFIR